MRRLYGINGDQNLYSFYGFRESVGRMQTIILGYKESKVSGGNDMMQARMIELNA